MNKQTQLYLKKNQIKHSSFYIKGFCKVKKYSLKEQPKTLCRLSTNRVTECYKNFSQIFSNKNKSVQLPKSDNLSSTLSPLKDPKITGKSFYSSSYQDNSQRRNHKQKSDHRQQQKNKTPNQQSHIQQRLKMHNLKNELIFQNQLLSKPLNDSFPKIKITKRRFKIPKNKQLSQYCPWLAYAQEQNQNQNLNQDGFIFNNF